MTTFWIIFGICAALVALLILLNTGNGKQPATNSTMVNETDQKEEECHQPRSQCRCFKCPIAGVQYRNDKEDVGGFFGYVKLEPENEFDPNAVAIYRNDGKLIGYIPKDMTREYREWTSEERRPCVGFIDEGDYAPLYGRVKILDIDKQEEADVEAIRYVRWLVTEFGVKFIPDEVEVTPRPRTKKEWLEFLDRQVGNLETLNRLDQQVKDLKRSLNSLK